MFSNFHRHCIRPVHSLAVAGLVAIACNTARADVVIANYEHDNLFNYRIDHMPDLDQRRDTLFNDGRSHCSPTATLNLILYAANHGFDDVQPGPNYWQAQENYLTASGLIATMGGFMQTDIDGTNGSEAVAGLEWYLAFQPDYFTINHHLTTPGYTTDFVNVAKSVLNGNIGTMSYGRYDILGYENGIPKVQRDNGHVTTIARCYRNGNDMRIWVRDPSSSDPLDVQSPFTSRLMDVTTLTVILMDNEDPPNEVGERTMSALDYDPTSDRVALMDGHLSIRPKAGYSFSSSVTEISQQAIGTFTGGPAPTHGTIPSPNGVIFDASWSPVLQEYLVIAGDPNQQQLYRVNPLNGESRPVPMNSTPKLAEACANGSHLVVFGDGSVRLLSASLDVIAHTTLPPDSFSINFGKINFEYRPQKAESVGSEPQIVMGSTPARKVLYYPMDLSKPTIRNLPTMIPGNLLDMAIEPETGRVWFCMDQGNTLYGVLWDDAGNADVRTLNHPSINSPTSLDFDDKGNLYVSAGPHVKVFKGNGAAGWTEDPTSPFHNMATAGTFRMMRNSSNYDPAIHNHPRWTKQIDSVELDEPGEVLADCVADIVPDDKVNVSDLLAVINAWGPALPLGTNAADTNGSGNVGVEDLLTIITHWGPCF